jgi:hypothetical protein
LTITHATTGLGTCPNCGSDKVERPRNERLDVLTCRATVTGSDGKQRPCGARWAGVRECKGAGR